MQEARRPLLRFEWSALIIDEGHRLKGESSQLARELQTLRVRPQISETLRNFICTGSGHSYLFYMRRHVLTCNEYQSEQGQALPPPPPRPPARPAFSNRTRVHA